MTDNYGSSDPVDWSNDYLMDTFIIKMRQLVQSQMHGKATGPEYKNKLKFHHTMRKEILERMGGSDES